MLVKYVNFLASLGSIIISVNRALRIYFIGILVIVSVGTGSALFRDSF